MAGTEEFLVEIRYTNDFPVALVRCLEVDPSDCVPSTAVIVVREFLERELKSRATSDETYRFSSLGPSPFHAEFYLSPSDSMADQSGDIAYKRTASLAYDEIEFLYNPKRFPHPIQAAEALFDLISDELGLYYHMVRYNQLGMRETSLLEAGVSHLLDLHERRGIQGIAGRLFKSGRVARGLLLEMLQAEGEALRAKARFSHALKSQYAANRLQAFRTDLESELEELQSQDPHSRDIVMLLESRRTRDTELAMLLTSSLLGGLAGAAITALVS